MKIRQLISHHIHIHPYSPKIDLNTHPRVLYLTCKFLFHHTDPQTLIGRENNHMVEKSLP